MKGAVYLYLNHMPKNGYYTPEIIHSQSNQIYEIQDRINSGGNAVVHKCQNLFTGAIYAVKFQLIVNEKRRLRFQQEINFLKSVYHDQLIRYIDDGIVEAKDLRRRDIEIQYIVMELAEYNLHKYLRDEGRGLTYAKYIGQFKGLSLALATIHKKAIHRDIKPENILISGETWLISDFGLCRFLGERVTELTHVDEVVGPRFWMSPEALNRTLGNSDEILKQSDVFQLCAIFWYVVTGRNPYGVVSRDDWNGPDAIFEVIFNALSHDPNRRPKDGRELYELLEEATMLEAFGA